MTCRYDDGKGWCTGRLEGFACVGNKCLDHPGYASKNGECPDQTGEGVYCPRYNKFFCAGKDQCSDHDHIIKMMRI